MTDWEAMSARDRDAEVAVAVCGWRHTEGFSGVYTDGSTIATADGIPHYTTTYEGMGLVIAEMKNRERNVSIASNWNHPAGDWLAEIWDNSRPGTMIADTYADTAPEAVARAALKAAEAE